jgi:hypothetical protein
MIHSSGPMRSSIEMAVQFADTYTPPRSGPANRESVRLRDAGDKAKAPYRAGPGTGLHVIGSEKPAGLYASLAHYLCLRVQEFALGNIFLEPLGDDRL